MEVILNGNEIRSIDDFHLKMKKLLELPDYYGENLDALWDCLIGWVEMPVTLTWRNYETSKRQLGGFAEEVKTIFEDAEKEMSEFRLKIEN